MKSIFAALAAIAATVVSAQNIVSSQPGLNQVLVAGTSAQIVWAPVSGVISSIDLRQGAASALGLVANVATNVPATSGSFTWNIPATTPAGADYALSFGLSPNVTYSPFFTIQAAGGSASSSVAGVSSSAAVSSSSAAAVSSSSSAVAATTSSAAAVISTVAPAASAASSSHAASSASASASASVAVTTSGASKNVAAVGVMAVAGAVAVALI